MSKTFIIDKIIKIYQIFGHSNITRDGYINYNINGFFINIILYININLYINFNIYIDPNKYMKTNIGPMTINQPLFQSLLFNNI